MLCLCYCLVANDATDPRVCLVVSTPGVLSLHSHLPRVLVRAELASTDYTECDRGDGLPLT